MDTFLQNSLSFQIIHFIVVDGSDRKMKIPWRQNESLKKDCAECKASFAITRLPSHRLSQPRQFRSALLAGIHAQLDETGNGQLSTGNLHENRDPNLFQSHVLKLFWKI